MKLLFTVLMSLFLVACEEGGSSTPSALPAVGQPIVEGVINDNKIYIAMNVQAPTNVEVKIEPFVEGIGFDSDNAQIVQQVVDSENNNFNVQLSQYSRVTVTVPQGLEFEIAMVFNNVTLMTSASSELSYEVNLDLAD